MPIADHTVLAMLSRDERWPALPLDAWADTRETLHMWTQIVGKLNVELAPFQNQLWHTSPQEILNPTPFDEDTGNAYYDPQAVNRWWRILTSTSRVMLEHRSWFRSKASPVHWFWGSFDLTATRHNGELATPPPGGYIYR